MPLKTKGSGATASALFALSLALTGCEDIPWNPDRWGLDRLDVLSVNGRTGDVPMNYDTLMRLGAAARASGDLPNALSLYRRAASLESNPPAPFIAIGNTLLEAMLNRPPLLQEWKVANYLLSASVSDGEIICLAGIPD